MAVWKVKVVTGTLGAATAVKGKLDPVAYVVVLDVGVNTILVVRPTVH